MTATAIIILSSITVGAIAWVIKTQRIVTKFESDYNEDNKKASKMKECPQCHCEFPQFYFTQSGICQHCNYQNKALSRNPIEHATPTQPPGPA